MTQKRPLGVWAIIVVYLLLGTFGLMATYYSTQAIWLNDKTSLSMDLVMLSWILVGVLADFLALIALFMMRKIAVLLVGVTVALHVINGIFAIVEVINTAMTANISAPGLPMAFVGTFLSVVVTAVWAFGPAILILHYVMRLAKKRVLS